MLPNTAESLVIHPKADSVGVSMSEFVKPYSNPDSIDIVIIL
jgi:hypothetical protein